MTKGKKHTSSKRQYETGYGKPPRHSRFKPGQSGNPKGRPKHARNKKTEILEILEAPVSISVGGQQKSVAAFQAMLMRLREKALNGELRAVFRLLDLALQLDGDAPSQDEHSNLSREDEAILQAYLTRHAIKSGGKNA